MFGIRFRPKKFLGIDIGTSYIRVLEIRRRHQKFQLENYGEINTPFIRKKYFRTPKRGNIFLSDRDIARAIQLICKEARIQTKEVNFSIPDFSSFYTSFEIPTMHKDEISEAIKYEVRPYVPLPVSEITLDWLVTKGEPSKTPLQVLVVAIPNKIINQYQSIARLSGLKLRTLEPEVFALARAVIGEQKNKKKKEEKKDIVGLIDIGSRSTTCSIIEGNTLRTSHSFKIAGNELTERLVRSMNIDYNKAKELRNKYGLTSVLEKENQASHENIRKILIPLIDSILEDIKKIFRAFYKEEGKEVEKIILTGGLALLPGLKKYFFQDLKKEIIIANPFLNISHLPILKETLQQKGPSYAIAVGLALKGLE